MENSTSWWSGMSGGYTGALHVGGMYSVDVTDRAASHISSMVESTRAWAQRPGEVYTLRAASAGPYPNLRGGVSFLSAGDIWKIGESINGIDRYSGTFYRAFGLAYQTEYVGGQLQIKMVEKMMLSGYVIEFGNVPPGNRILR